MPTSLNEWTLISSVKISEDLSLLTGGHGDKVKGANKQWWEINR
jgi:hypothetical protein